MDMTKFTRHIYRRILRLKVRVRFKQLHWTNVGEQKGREISIDLKGLAHPARIFVHECLHVLNPETKESKILALERKMWKELGRKEILTLYRRMFRR